MQEVFFFSENLFSFQVELKETDKHWTYQGGRNAGKHFISESLEQVVVLKWIVSGVLKLPTHIIL